MSELDKISEEIRAAVGRGDFAAAVPLLGRQRAALRAAGGEKELARATEELQQLRLLVMAQRANDQVTLAALRKPLVYPFGAPAPVQSWRFDG